MPQEFVSRNLRVRPSNSYTAEMYASGEALKPSYSYERIGDVKNNFPVELYAEPTTIAFMQPITRNIAMPSGEKAKYWFEHVLGHEVDHVIRDFHGHDQNEYGCSVNATRRLGLFDRFPVHGSYQPPNGLYV